MNNNDDDGKTLESLSKLARAQSNKYLQKRKIEIENQIKRLETLVDRGVANIQDHQTLTKLRREYVLIDIELNGLI